MPLFPRQALARSHGPARLGATWPTTVAVAAILLILLSGCGGSEPSIPTTIALDQSSLSFTALGQTQQLTPSISDQRGDPLPDAAVTWSTSNAGVAAVSLSGLVTAQGAGTAQVTATAGSAMAVAEIAVVQTPTQLQKVSGDGQTITAGQMLAAPLVVQVTDALGNPVGGATVTFVVVQGGGSIGASPVTTSPDGRASTTFTTGGSVASPQRVDAGIAATTISVSFIATATAGPPASITASSGANQPGVVGTPVSIRPAVLVTDVNANPVAGVAVVFEVISGGGSIAAGSTVTNASGVAQVGSWTLGASSGENELSATAAGLGIIGNPVRFRATATTRSFNIVVRFLSSATPTQRDAFTDAERRWEELIVGDLPNIPLSIGSGECRTAPAVNETIDDVLIFATLEPIDGTGRTLAEAGPCFIRISNNLPILGVMRFDTEDLDFMESAGVLPEVILHEMGHVLGFGSLWPLQGLLADAAGSGGIDPHFTGAQAIGAFDQVGGSLYAAGRKVPVENSGGPGLADGHWRESVLDSEIMSGFLDLVEELSVVTVASFADQGYTVNLSAADPYTLSRSRRTAAAAFRVRLQNDILRIPIRKVDGTGQVVEDR
jgi:hypothetical protein